MHVKFFKEKIVENSGINFKQNIMKKSFTIFVLLSALFSGWSGVVAQINLDSGLVAYYPFNGNANDESGNGNDGTVNGATLTADRFGMLIRHIVLMV